MSETRRDGMRVRGREGDGWGGSGRSEGDIGLGAGWWRIQEKVD